MHKRTYHIMSNTYMITNSHGKLFGYGTNIYEKRRGLDVVTTINQYAIQTAVKILLHLQQAPWHNQWLLHNHSPDKMH